MEFPVYRRHELEEYERSVRRHWTAEEPFAPYEPPLTEGDERQRDTLGRELMGIFIALGRLRIFAPDAPEVQEQVEHLHRFLITEHGAYPPEQLLELARQYEEDERLQGSIDNAGGIGTALLARRAIEVYCGRMRA